MRGLRIRLILLVFFALVPAIGFVAYLGYEGYDYFRNDTLVQIRQLASLSAQNVRARFDSGRDLLDALSRVSFVKALKGQEAEAYFRNIISGFPNYASLCLVDKDGRIIAGTSNCTAITTAKQNGTEWLTRLRARPVFTVLKPEKGPYGRTNMTLVKPIFQDGEFRAALLIVMDDDWPRDLYEKAEMPTGAGFSIVNNYGEFFVRYPADADGDGSEILLKGEELEKITSGARTYEGMGRDGVSRVYGYAEFYDSGQEKLYFRVCLPSSQFRSMAGSSLMQEILVLILGAICASVASLIFARRTLLEPISRMVEAVKRVSQGDFTYRLPAVPDSVTAKCELDVLTSAFNNMARELEIRSDRLRMTEGRYRRLVENAGEGVFRTAPKGVILEMNPAALRMLGYVSLDEMQKTVTVFEKDLYVEPTDRARLIAALERDGLVHDLEVRLKRRDGSSIWVLINAGCVRDEEGRSVTYEGLLTDITTLKENESRLAEAKSQAEAANRAKGDFLANMSHEIRTPISGIIGVAGMVLKKTMSPDLHEDVSMIHDAAMSLLAIVNDILDLSRMEAGKMRINYDDFDLMTFLRRLEGMYSIEAGNRGLKLNVDIAPDVPPRVCGDPARLAQVLRNLIGNALKFTECGEIRIEVRSISESLKGPRLLFCVKDTGIGISSDMQVRLFRKFAQADESVSRRHGGTGLGLYISKHLVEMMGGRIWLESAPGMGSRFYFTIQFAKADPARPLLTLAGEDGAVPKVRALRILVAEDNTINRKFIVDLLTSDGHTVVQAENGEAAVRAWREGGIDLILMDVQMPVMDGLSASRAIRAAEAEAGTGHVPIIALTADILVSNRELVLSAGMDEYMAKPLNPEVFFAMLERLFRNAGPDTPAGRPVCPPAEAVAEEKSGASAAGTGTSGPAAQNEAIQSDGSDLPEGYFEDENTLRRFRGNAELLAELRHDLVSGMAQENCDQIAKALAVADYVEVKLVAHTLKGSCAAVGAETLRELARRTEMAAVAGDSAALDRLLAAMRRETAALVRSLPQEPVGTDGN